MIWTGLMACDINGAVGLNNELPWDIKSELEYFRFVTQNKVLLMGSVTYLSMPKSVWRDRKAVVLSRKKNNFTDELGNIWLDSWDSACKLNLDDKGFFIGGAQMANWALSNNLLDDFFLSIIHGSYQGDVFLNLNFFSLWDKQPITSNNDFDVFYYKKK